MLESGPISSKFSCSHHGHHENQQVMSPDRASPSSLDRSLINLIIKWGFDVVRKSQSAGQRKLYESGRQRKSTEARRGIDKKALCEVGK